MLTSDRGKKGVVSSLHNVLHVRTYVAMDMEVSRSAEDGSELLMSTETLGCDSPVMWPDQNFCKFIIL